MSIYAVFAEKSYPDESPSALAGPLGYVGVILPVNPDPYGSVQQIAHTRLVELSSESCTLRNVDRNPKFGPMISDYGQYTGTFHERYLGFATDIYREYNHAAVVTPTAESRIWVFAVGDEGHVYVTDRTPNSQWPYWPGTDVPWPWNGVAIPPGGKVVGRPAAVATLSGYVGFFAVGRDDHLYECRMTRGADEHSERGTWADRGNPSALASSPYPDVYGLEHYPAAVAGPGGYMGVFVIGGHSDSPRLFELRYTPSKGWRWIDHGTAASVEARSLAACVAPPGYVGVWARSTGGETLHEWTADIS